MLYSYGVTPDKSRAFKFGLYQTLIARQVASLLNENAEYIATVQGDGPYYIWIVAREHKGWLTRVRGDVREIINAPGLPQ